MAPLTGAIKMKLLSIKAVREIVLYSRQHIARLEKAGHFPKRVRLGPGRVGWIEREVQDWLEARIAARDAATGS
jgi:prophage regulatory protein